MAAISINWSDLANVAAVSAAFTVGIVVVFTLGILALTRRESARESGASGSQPATVLLAGACFLLCAAAGAYGIYLIVPQWGG